MTPFKRAFAQATARYGRFNHAAHLFVAWHLLRDRPALAALAEFRTGLRDLATSMGLQGKYSETLTVAWFFAVLDHRDRAEDWEAFEASTPHLLDPAYLHAFYPPDVLGSPAARAQFLPPERAE
ncbi:hypothetical protein [Deinococcus sp. JMULE3]|uniref:hypothetical protein n=1 Tax=Deinococcus sp. JMULE3 TaxID=2518341 RepID=UPI001575FC01|nr:hypothetical protein [Deinococcus sp. JMULE3]NTY00144.1 hypothetical protein [Deinococcus sp. JMULE3]